MRSFTTSNCSYEISIVKQEHKMDKERNFHGRVEKCIQGGGRKESKKLIRKTFLE